MLLRALAAAALLALLASGARAQTACTAADQGLFGANTACQTCLAFPGPFGACGDANACAGAVLPFVTAPCSACATQMANEGASLAAIAAKCAVLPDTWTTSPTCSPAFYDACDGDDCACGAPDPDANTPACSLLVYNCPVPNSACQAGACVEPAYACTAADQALFGANAACQTCLAFPGPFGACGAANACAGAVLPVVTPQCSACATQLANEGASLGVIAATCAALPAAWTTSPKCSPSFYNACDGIDCTCGIRDPDALSANPACRAETWNCAPGQTCSLESTCVVPPTPAPTPAPPTPAPAHTVLQICDVSDTDETALLAPLICTAPAADGASPLLYFVTADSFGVRSLLSGAVVQQATWASVGLAGEPQQACATDAASGTFYVWLGIAPSTFLPLGLNMTTLQPAVVGLVVPFGAFGLAVDALLAAAYHPQRGSVMTTTAEVTGAAAANTALLLEFSPTTLATAVYPTLQGTIIAGNPFNGSGSRAPTVVVLADGTVVVMLAGYANVQVAPDLWLSVPAHVSYSAPPSGPVLRMQTGFHATVDATPNHFGEVTQQACGNARYNMLAFSYRTRYFDVELNATVENTAEATHIYAAGVFVTETYTIVAPGPNEYAGSCVWDRLQTGLFRTLYTRADDGTTQTQTRRYSITLGIDATQNPPPGTPYFQVEVLSNTTHGGFAARSVGARGHAARGGATAHAAKLHAAPFAGRVHTATFAAGPALAFTHVSVSGAQPQARRGAARSAPSVPVPHDGRIAIYFADSTTDRILFSLGGARPVLAPALAEFDVFYVGAPQCAPTGCPPFYANCSVALDAVKVVDANATHATFWTRASAEGALTLTVCGTDLAPNTTALNACYASADAAECPRVRCLERTCDTATGNDTTCALLVNIEALRAPANRDLDYVTYEWRACGGATRRGGVYEVPPYPNVRTQALDWVTFTGAIDLRLAPSLQTFASLRAGANVLGTPNGFSTIPDYVGANVFVGDTIAASRSGPNGTAQAETLDDYRKEWRFLHAQPEMAALHERATTYALWHNTEVQQRWHQDLASRPRAEAASQAYDDYMPRHNTTSHWARRPFLSTLAQKEFVYAASRFSPLSSSAALYDEVTERIECTRRPLYRRERRSESVELFFVDTQSCRTPSLRDKCNNDLFGPFFPLSARTQFYRALGIIAPTAIAPALPAECIANANNQQRTLLGQEQLDRLIDDLTNSTAFVKIIVTPARFNPYLTTAPWDTWAEYPGDALGLLAAIEERAICGVRFVSESEGFAGLSVVFDLTGAPSMLEVHVPPAAAPTLLERGGPGLVTQTLYQASLLNALYWMNGTTRGFFAYVAAPSSNLQILAWLDETGEPIIADSLLVSPGFNAIFAADYSSGEAFQSTTVPRQRPGCDGVLCSRRVVDRCGVCGGDGTACETSYGQDVCELERTLLCQPDDLDAIINSDSGACRFCAFGYAGAFASCPGYAQCLADLDAMPSQAHFGNCRACLDKERVLDPTATALELVQRCNARFPAHARALDDDAASPDETRAAAIARQEEVARRASARLGHAVTPLTAILAAVKHAAPAAAAMARSTSIGADLLTPVATGTAAATLVPLAPCTAGARECVRAYVERDAAVVAALSTAVAETHAAVAAGATEQRAAARASQQRGVSSAPPAPTHNPLTQSAQRLARMAARLVHNARSTGHSALVSTASSGGAGSTQRGGGGAEEPRPCGHDHGAEDSAELHDERVRFAALAALDGAGASSRARALTPEQRGDGALPQPEEYEPLNVPVCAHVVWNTPAENRSITVAGIEAMIQKWNDDFSGATARRRGVEPEFVDLIGDTRIRFHLVQVKRQHLARQAVRNGAASAFLAASPGFGNIMAPLHGGTGGINAEPMERCVNVHFVSPIDGNVPLGVAYVAGSIPWGGGFDFFFDNVMGVWMSTLSMVSPDAEVNVTASGVGLPWPYRDNTLATVLSHEGGHMYDLRHASDFQCNENYIDDLPGGPGQGASLQFGARLRMPACDDTGTGKNVSVMNRQNIMDYTSDAATNMFTRGQARWIRHHARGHPWSKLERASLQRWDARADACGVVGGFNETCAGCDGVARSGERVDACGVCGGDARACVDCEGMQGGASTEDACGNCNGALKVLGGESLVTTWGYDMERFGWLYGHTRYGQRAVAAHFRDELALGRLVGAAEPCVYGAVLRFEGASLQAHPDAAVVVELVAEPVAGAPPSGPALASRRLRVRDIAIDIGRQQHPRPIEADREALFADDYDVFPRERTYTRRHERRLQRRDKTFVFWGNGTCVPVPRDGPTGFYVRVRYEYETPASILTFQRRNGLGLRATPPHGSYGDGAPVEGETIANRDDTWVEDPVSGAWHVSQDVHGQRVRLDVRPIFRGRGPCPHVPSGAPVGAPIDDRLGCDGVAYSERVPDACGVCGGDGTSCLDCEGTAWGEKRVDACGVCGGDGTLCRGCAENTMPDACGRCALATSRWPPAGAYSTGVAFGLLGTVVGTSLYGRSSPLHGRLSTFSRLGDAGGWGNATQLNGVAYEFSYARSTVTPALRFRAVVYEVVAGAGDALALGALLGTKLVSFEQAREDSERGAYTYVFFDTPVALPSGVHTIAVGIDDLPFTETSQGQPVGGAGGSVFTPEFDTLNTLALASTRLNGSREDSDSAIFVREWYGNWYFHNAPGLANVPSINGTVRTADVQWHMWPLFSGAERCDGTCQRDVGGCDGLGGVRDACDVCNGDGSTCRGCDGTSLQDTRHVALFCSGGGGCVTGNTASYFAYLVPREMDLRNIQGGGARFLNGDGGGVARSILPVGHGAQAEATAVASRHDVPPNAPRTLRGVELRVFQLTYETGDETFNIVVYSDGDARPYELLYREAVRVGDVAPQVRDRDGEVRLALKRTVTVPRKFWIGVEVTFVARGKRNQTPLFNASAPATEMRAMDFAYAKTTSTTLRTMGRRDAGGAWYHLDVQIPERVGTTSPYALYGDYNRTLLLSPIMEGPTTPGGLLDIWRGVDLSYGQPVCPRPAPSGLCGPSTEFPRLTQDACGACTLRTREMPLGALVSLTVTAAGDAGSLTGHSKHMLDGFYTLVNVEGRPAGLGRRILGIAARFGVLVGTPTVSYVVRRTRSSSLAATARIFGEDMPGSVSAGLFVPGDIVYRETVALGTPGTVAGLNSDHFFATPLAEPRGPYFVGIEIDYPTGGYDAASRLALGFAFAAGAEQDYGLNMFAPGSTLFPANVTAYVRRRGGIPTLQDASVEYVRFDQFAENTALLQPAFGSRGAFGLAPIVAACGACMAPPLIVAPWLAVDACGVCSGFDASCTDCAGVVHGTATRDACGVCQGNGASCAGCDGVPNSGRTRDECGVCGGDGTSCQCWSNMDCQNGGHCNLLTHACQCCEGFGGALCQNRTCTFESCGAHGQCVPSEGVCACDAGWVGATCDWNLCSGHGVWCREDAACRCFNGYVGPTCAQCEMAMAPPPPPTPKPTPPPPTPAPCTPKLVTVTSTKEGTSYKFKPGDPLRAGYKFQFTGSHAAANVRVQAPTVTISVRCTSGSSGPVYTATLPLSPNPYDVAVPLNSLAWFPDTSFSVASTCQSGVVTAPTLCGAGNWMYATLGATFTAQLYSDVAKSIVFQFQYGAACNGPWSSSCPSVTSSCPIPAPPPPPTPAPTPPPPPTPAPSYSYVCVPQSSTSTHYTRLAVPSSQLACWLTQGTACCGAPCSLHPAVAPGTTAWSGWPLDCRCQRDTDPYTGHARALGAPSNARRSSGAGPRAIDSVRVTVGAATHTIQTDTDYVRYTGDLVARESELDAAEMAFQFAHGWGGGDNCGGGGGDDDDDNSHGGHHGGHHGNNNTTGGEWVVAGLVVLAIVLVVLGVYTVMMQRPRRHPRWGM